MPQRRPSSSIRTSVSTSTSTTSSSVIGPRLIPNGRHNNWDNIPQKVRHNLFLKGRKWVQMDDGTWKTMGGQITTICNMDGEKCYHDYPVKLSNV